MKRFSNLSNNRKFVDYDLNKFFISALCEEFIAWYFYVTIGKVLYGPARISVEKFFEETAKDEYEDHAEWLMKRMQELGISMADVYDPSTWNMWAVHPYVPFDKSEEINVANAINKAIKMEEEAIETYTEFERFTRDNDPVTNTKIKEILADEIEHLTELNNFAKDLSVK
jgi:bacterioferritin